MVVVHIFIAGPFEEAVEIASMNIPTPARRLGDAVLASESGEISSDVTSPDLVHLRVVCLAGESLKSLADAFKSPVFFISILFSSAKASASLLFLNSLRFHLPSSLHPWTRWVRYWLPCRSFQTSRIVMPLDATLSGVTRVLFFALLMLAG